MIITPRKEISRERHANTWGHSGIRSKMLQCILPLAYLVLIKKPEKYLLCTRDMSTGFYCVIIEMGCCITSTPCKYYSQDGT